MKWKVAAAVVATAAIVSSPLASAKPGNGNGKKPVSPPGQTISAIAKNGGGAAGVLGALIGLKPTNKGLQNALNQVTKPKPTPDPTPTPTPATCLRCRARPDPWAIWPMSTPA